MDPNEKLREKIAEMSIDALYRSMQTAMDNILSEEESSLADARLLAELLNELNQRQRGARTRIGEYFRQRAIREAGRRPLVRGREPQRSDDLIDTVFADRYASRVGLRYSDIETLAPALERDSKAAFLAKQKDRLAAQLAANPKLTAKQKDLLAAAALGECTVYSDYKYGPSYRGPNHTRLDGRSVKGLIERKILMTSSTGDIGHSSMIVVAPVAE
jgi:hypothetical protein